jgi:DNA-binding NtrC family response regulator
MATKKSPLILIVDDEVDICEMMSYSFKHHGFVTEVAYGPDEAFALIQQKKFDVVLSDIRMPKGGGLRLLDDINKHCAERPKVFLMTGYSDSPMDEAIAKGAEAVFAKPMKIKEIVERIFKSL